MAVNIKSFNGLEPTYVMLNFFAKIKRFIFLTLRIIKNILSIQGIIGEVVSGLLSSNFYRTEVVGTTASEKQNYIHRMIFEVSKN